MPKYEVYGTVKVSVIQTIEADSEEEAERIAEEEWAGLTNYAGNGGTNQLVGVNDSSISLDTTDISREIEIDETHEVEE